MISSNAKWIWINDSPSKNEYAFFEGDFDFDGMSAVFSIAAEIDYILRINGEVASFGQFAGYPFEKYFDEIDITHLCNKGNNRFDITVRYEGMNSATHIDDGAGVIFTLELDGKADLWSSERTLGGYDSRFIQNQVRYISSQLGMTSGMRSVYEKVYEPCIEVEKSRNLKKRPVKKAKLQEFVEGTPISEGSRVYDLGREEAGYIRLRVRARSPETVIVAYGEHIADGGVRHRIEHRNFTIDFEVTEGEHELVQLFLRVSARYLEILSGDDVEILSIGLIPLLYPLTEKSFHLEGLDKRIYDTCIHTLRLCMNTHYEDCPWREQALYVMDSRNQMLCGYKAFEEYEFQRANLVFIGKGVREDGLLELTYPAINTPAIPFFSLMYPVAVYEYVENTGDKSILEETMPTMLGIMNAVKSRIDDGGSIPEFEPPYWNFFEWTEGNSGDASSSPYHLNLNCAFINSCNHFQKLCDMAGVSFEVDLERVKKATVRDFFDESTGLFSMRPNEKRASMLGCAMALLAGLGDERTVEAIKYNKELVPASLSMLTFVYDALIMHDKSCKEFILSDIREKYGYMLQKGATTFWETLDGESAFNKAGSLCHGWSAMPVYYYHLFAE